MKLFEVQEDKSGNKKIKILLGLIYIKMFAAGCAGSIRVLGIRLFIFHICKDKIVWYFKPDFKIPIFCMNAERREIKQLDKWIRKNYKKTFDSVYCLFGSPSGECYLVLTILNILLKNNNSSKPLLLVNQKFKYNLCKLLRPNIPVLLCREYSYFYFHSSDKILYKNTPYYIYFPTKHYLKQDKLINKKGEHFYNYILKELHINKNEVKKCRINVSDKIKLKIKKYIKQNKLNNFVIVSPEANTSGGNKIWQKLYKELHNQGFQILLNTDNLNSKIKYTKPFFFSYAELLELSKYAKAVIGLRSGLLDILTLNSELKIISFYTDFPKRGYLKHMDSSKCLPGFSLKRLPDAGSSNIYEFDMNNIKNKDLITEILNICKS